MPSYAGLITGFSQQESLRKRSQSCGPALGLIGLMTANEKAPVGDL